MRTFAMLRNGIESDMIIFRDEDDPANTWYVYEENVKHSDEVVEVLNSAEFGGDDMPNEDDLESAILDAARRDQ